MNLKFGGMALFNENKIDLGRVVVFALLAIAAVIWIIPLLWMISTSFKPESEVIAGGFSLIPKQVTLENYKSVLFDKTVAEQAPVLRWFSNSLFISITHTVLMLLLSSLAAYAYSRMQFRGRNTLFILLISTMMIPAVVNLIPLYKIMTILKWVDTPWAMIFPGLGNVFGIFLIRQFMLGIPSAYDESAKIDGASHFVIYSRIIIPLTKPVLTVVALFTFMANWNDFLWPIIATNKTENRTLPAGLKILQGFMTTQYSKLMVATVLSALPVFIVFLFARKYFVNGISLSGGVKG